MRRDVAARARSGGVKMRRYGARRYDVAQLSATRNKTIRLRGVGFIFAVYNQAEPRRLYIATE